MSGSSNEYVTFLRRYKHLAVTPMDKSQVDICRRLIGEVLFETCFRHECNLNTIHVTLINNRSKLAFESRFIGRSVVFSGYSCFLLQ